MAKKEIGSIIKAMAKEEGEGDDENGCDSDSDTTIIYPQNNMIDETVDYDTVESKFGRMIEEEAPAQPKEGGKGGTKEGGSATFAIDLCNSDDDGGPPLFLLHVSHDVIDLCDSSSDNDDQDDYVTPTSPGAEVMVWAAPSPMERLRTAQETGRVLELD